MTRIHSLGSNSGGQLGTGDTEDLHYLTPTKRIDEGGSWRITGGGNHTVLWSPSHRDLWVCGSNQDNQIFVSEDSVLEWQKYEMGEGVRELACGWNHTVVVTDSGSIRCFGSNKFNQLDNSHLPRTQQYARIACGMRHSMALDTEGRVHGWGTNRHNQLGIDNSQLPAMSMVACGRHHSVVISKDQAWVYVCGQNKHKQHGASSADGWSRWELPAKAIKLCCGWEFTAALMEDQRVVMWGRSDHGQLGSESSEKVYIELPDGIRDICCGSNHTVAITHTGAVYMWGWNEHGNAGDPALKDIWEPRQIVKGAKGIGTGYGNTFIVFE